MKKTLVACICCIVLCFVMSACHSHEWSSATCTEPETCECGDTRGEPLGHNWLSATCVQPQTCGRCRITEGESLGHKFTEWKQTVVPTCTEVGAEEAICENCDYLKIREIDTIAHTEGEWVITKEASVDAAGTRVCSCVVCGNTVKSESYNLSEEELAQAYKDMQEMVVVNVRNDGVGYLNSNHIYVTVKNVSDKVVKEYSVAMLCFDKDGYPVVPQYEDSNIIAGRAARNIQPGREDGANYYWTVFSDVKLYVKACVRYVEYHDGTTWENPYLVYWYRQEKDAY